jgi:hypothetical protein
MPSRRAWPCRGAWVTGRLRTPQRQQDPRLACESPPWPAAMVWSAGGTKGPLCAKMLSTRVRECRRPSVDSGPGASTTGQPIAVLRSRGGAAHAPRQRSGIAPGGRRGAGHESSNRITGQRRESVVERGDGEIFDQVHCPSRACRTDRRQRRRNRCRGCRSGRGRTEAGSDPEPIQSQPAEKA